MQIWCYEAQALDVECIKAFFFGRIIKGFQDMQLDGVELRAFGYAQVIHYHVSQIQRLSDSIG